MKNILGLDLGTNSIGWALIKSDFNIKEGMISGLGSRILPMTQEVLGKFDSGVTKSQTADRTKFRGVRRLYQRDNSRRERLHRVLNILGFLPEHYANAIDFRSKPGQFIDGQEVKLNYIPKDRPEKHQFIFMNSFIEMANEFEANGHNAKIPYDWTLYYLRKKALAYPITKEELSWIILNFNQKRGYYQLRGEDEPSDTSKTEEYYQLKILSIEPTDRRNEKGIWYKVHLENGWIYNRQSIETLDSWIGSTKEFIVTTQLEKDGSPKKDKDGEIKRSFRAPKEDDWKLMKKKSEHNLALFNEQHHTVGVAHFIYSKLLNNPQQKIRGGLIKTIERKYYKEELKRILEIQAQFHTEFKDRELYNNCVEELYPNNEAHKKNIKDQDLRYLILNDIIFYQRPLKSKKSTIANCQYEYRKYKDAEGIEQTEFKKGIPKSHPLYQEFRLWQFLKNLKIYVNERSINGISQLDLDVTKELLPDEDAYADLFDYLSGIKVVEQIDIIKYFIAKKIIHKTDKDIYRWNYVPDKAYPSGETYALFLSRLKKVINDDTEIFLSKEVELHLWHIIYSVRDKTEFEKAIAKFAANYQLDTESFIEHFKKIPPFSNEYGSYSEKALKKLVPLMRRGKYWNEKDICEDARDRIESIIERLQYIDFSKEKIDTSVADDEIPKQLLKSFLEFKNSNPFTGLNTYQACYGVYGRHSESGNAQIWRTPSDIDHYLKEFKQHSLRNPIVEQVVTETLRVVRDIWLKFGDGKENFFDEIHIELGRAMKNPADKRRRMTEQITENQNTNERIKRLLQELMNDADIQGDVRPYSPSHQEILKLYEEGVYHSADKIDDDIEKIRKNTNPSRADIVRYKLWLDQGYYSPYTGKMIPLSGLFTTDYQIEHIIPQSRYFDDSLSNKVICESAVNELKDNDIAYDFITDKGGQRVDLGNGRTVDIYTIEDYKSHCNRYFKSNKLKLKKLLSEDIPEGFIERQMNDTRYISKFIKGLLGNIVREENEIEATPKNLVSVSGSITSVLKKDWGLEDKWNVLIAPRFQRLNELTNSQDFGFWDSNINAFRTQVPDSIAKGFSKKRIDHRHHALDALVIACTTKDHINYITSINTARTNYKLVAKLRLVKEIQKINRQTGEISLRKVADAYHKPWSAFTTDAADQLATTIVSFKQNLRVINKTNNKYWSYKNEDGSLRLDDNGNPRKELIKQTKGENWAIRKPLHKETVSGKVTLWRKRKAPVSLTTAIENWQHLADKDIRLMIKSALILNQNDKKKTREYFKAFPISSEGKVVERYEIYEEIRATAIRTALNEKFTRKQLESITDTGITSILENHIKNYLDEKGNERFDLAFNDEGLENLNMNIKNLNNGKAHQPIRTVRIYEVGNKFSVGSKGNKKDKYVEAAKGTNLFFAVYWNEEKQKREYHTIPFNEVAEYQKQNAHLPKDQRTPIPMMKENWKLLFVLSPNDIVYVPTEEEMILTDYLNSKKLTKKQASRIYKMVSASLNQCFFVQANVATAIANKIEFSALNKTERDIQGHMIKDCCWKLDNDRLGNFRTFKIQ